jgi:hypothetical protein
MPHASPFQSLELKLLQNYPRRGQFSLIGGAGPLVSSRVASLQEQCQRQRHVGIYISVTRSTFCLCWVILHARMRSRFCFGRVSLFLYEGAKQTWENNGCVWHQRLFCTMREFCFDMEKEMWAHAKCCCWHSQSRATFLVWSWRKLMLLQRLRALIFFSGKTLSCELWNEEWPSAFFFYSFLYCDVNKSHLQSPPFQTFMFLGCVPKFI